MSSRRISLTAVAIGIAIVQFVLPIPALARINHGRVPQWRVEINQIDAGNSNIAPEFKIAIYENLVTELTKAKQFSAVLRGGDSSANGVSNLAFRFVHLAFGLQLCVAGDFSDCLLDGALDLLAHAFDSILIHILFSKNSKSKTVP